MNLDSLIKKIIIIIMNPDKKNNTLKRIGLIFLTLNSVPTIVLGFVFSIGLIFFDINPPILYIGLTESQIQNLDTRILSTFKDLAILFNGISTLYGILIIVLIFKGIKNGLMWCWTTVLILIGFSQTIGFVADYKLNNPTFFINLITTVFYIIGITLTKPKSYGK